MRARRAPRGQHRRASISPLLRLTLVKAIARVLRDRALRAEQVRMMLGEAAGGLGSLRRELADVKAHRTSLGFERLLVLCEVLGIDATAELSVGFQAHDRRLAA